MTILELKPYVKNLNLLIVEDEEFIRQTMATMFRRLFASVDEAVDGQDGYNKFKANPENYDIILTDINMPHMSGIEMIEAIRKDDATIPIVVLSAHNESERLISVINAGADAFLQKPFDSQTPVDSFYRLAIRISDSKMIHEYLEQIEDQNAQLLKKQQEVEKYDRALTIKMGMDKQPNIEEIKATLPQSTPAPVIDYSDYFNQLIREDVDELFDLISEIENYVLLTFQGEDINQAYITLLTDKFQRFGSILYRYPLFTKLAGSLFGLSTGVSSNQEKFFTQQEFVLPFLENLIFVLHKYVEDVWKKQAPNPHFYDASIMNDIDTFLSIMAGDNADVHNNAEDLLEFF